MNFSPRVRAILQALFVTVLWSTSWVLIKRTLDDVPSLTFAGLRYTIAFLILLPLLWKHKAEVRALSSTDWGQLITLGIVYYTLTQGGQFVTLNHLEAISFSLLLNFTTLIVAVFAIIFLHEIPSRLQWGGIAIFILGVLIYFVPALTQPSAPQAEGRWLGFALAGATVFANAVSGVLGRKINRSGAISPLVVTVISMGIGAILLLAVGAVVQGIPPISGATWVIIIWLAVVNTAFAFLLWNTSLQVLSAVESSIINNTMLVQIAILAWLFLGEQPTAWGLVGLALAVVGILLVNLKGK